VKYYEVEMTNVIISNIDQVLGDGGLLQDEIGLRYAKIVWRYTQQKIGGGAGGNTAGGWDLSTNRCTI
jgi:type VI secretion system secreted protein Hcp